MQELMNRLKTEKKWLYYLLIPVALVILFGKLLSELNLFKANKELQDTESKDIDLAKEQAEAQAKAKLLLDEANEHGTKAKLHEDKANTADSDLDWHLKE